MAERGDERESPTGLILIDLDGFKDVNTAHGYPAGDAVLRETAARLRGAVRSNDVVARLGGDEFAVLMRPTPPTRRCGRSPTGRSTASRPGLRRGPGDRELGWVLYPDDALSVDELIAAADFCLRGRS